jgi:predicted small secreted protein
MKLTLGYFLIIAGVLLGTALLSGCDIARGVQHDVKRLLP